MKYKDNGEEEHIPMSEMSSEIRVQADERKTRLPAELQSTLNFERRGACVSQITDEDAEEGEDWKQPMVSGVTEKLPKIEAQQKENKNSTEEQAAEQECSEQSKRAGNRKRGKVTKEEQEEKEVESDETQVYETPVSLRLAEVQDMAKQNEITERVRVTTPMMLSKLRGALEEMSASLQMELPRTLIDEGGGAAGAEEAADERFRRDTASKTMQELSKAGDQTVGKETLEKEQPAELLIPEKCVDSK